MNKRRKRLLLRNAKMLAVCGAMLYLANGLNSIKVETDVANANENAVLAEMQTEAVAAEQAEESMIGSPDWDGYESYLLAKIAMAEAEGEDTEGKALVILVVLNRVRSSEFPGTIEEVIFQDGQFSTVADGGRWWKVEPDSDCWDALALVESGWDESQNALYFESKSASKWHEQNLNFLFQHGNHYFYNEKE